jgi:predicted small lipoprotein YifL
MLNAKQILISPIVLGCALLYLTACGQTGPLYLPAKPATKPIQQQAPAQTPLQTPAQ